MSTSTLLKVEGTAWSVAKDIEEALQSKTSSRDIVESLGLDYTVSAHHMKTDIDEPVSGISAIYRDDEQKFLGCVNTGTPNLVQNVDTFSSLEPMLEDGTLRPLVADTYNGGRQMWGCMEYTKTFDVLGDSFKHYFIVVNNHLKPDGNVTVINTPVRIACMNAMSSALKRATLKFKIPAVVDEANRPVVAKAVADAYERSVRAIRKTAEDLVEIKVDRRTIDKILDELFPFIPETEEGSTNHDRANNTVQLQREAFVNCLNADNLTNFTGTAYQVFNALTDYATHYFRNSDKAFDLNHRMTLMPGMNPEATTELLKVSKFMNNLDRLVEVR